MLPVSTTETKDRRTRTSRHNEVMAESTDWGPQMPRVTQSPYHMPAGAGTVTDTVHRGGIPYIISGLPSWLQEVMLALIVVAFFLVGAVELLGRPVSGRQRGRDHFLLVLLRQLARRKAGQG